MRRTRRHLVNAGLAGIATTTLGVAMVAALVVAPPGTAATADAPGVEVSAAVHSDVSQPLGGRAPLSPTAHQLTERPLRLIPGQARFTADAAVQTDVSGAAAPTGGGLNFAGVGNGDYGFTDRYAPPDTTGAVGATQYVQWVNDAFAVFDKTTGAKVYGPAAGNTLWEGFGGGCETNNDGDPIVQYDKLANRWIMTQFSVSTLPYLQCVAVSQTPDATGAWNRYSFSYGNTQFNDYPKLGVWPDGYYVTYNIFTNAQTFAGAKVCALDRAKMLAGTAATQQCFQLSTAYGGLLPSDLDGTTAPPDGSPNYLMSFGSNSLNLWKFHADFLTPANTTLTGPTSIPVAAFSPACNGGGTCIPQPGTQQKLDSLADRLMYRLAYRNFGDHESLVVNHSVTVGSGRTASTGVRWYEIRNPSTTPSVFQQSTFAPDSTSRWMGSIAMDHFGNMALGYSASSSTVAPSIRYTGRLASDPRGTMQGEAVIKAGGGSQLPNLSRWGDYSTMTVDPLDDCTFWFTSEYLKSSGTFNWSTQIASFSFPGCNSSTPAIEYVDVTPTSASVVSGATQQFTAVAYDQSHTALSPQPTFSWGATGGTISGSGLFTAGSTAGDFQVTASAGSPVVTGTAAVTVTAPAGDFSVSASPSRATVTRGSSTTFNVTVTPTNGFAGPVSLALTGQPSGVTYGFNPPSTSGSSQLTVNAASTTAKGTYTLTITGTSGALSHSTTVKLQVR